MRAVNTRLKPRKTLYMSDFMGVDYTSNTNIPIQRAAEMRNFINEYGVNHKRKGWRQIATVSSEINGIFEYHTTDGHNEIIVHSGKSFYSMIKSNGIEEYELKRISTDDIEARTISQRSQVFCNRNKMYIIGCGDYLVYGRWSNGEYELRRVVDNEDTYIPTTTISIRDNEYIDKTPGGDQRTILQQINLLSNKRINELIGCSVKEKQDKQATWQLDSDRINRDSEVVVSVENEKEIVEYTNKSSSDKTKLIDSNGSQVGSVSYKDGAITLSVDTIPPQENTANIKVTFSASNHYSDKITNCDFGVLFGANGTSDRLFLSGNKMYPNIDFFSASDDYTYFGDFDYSVIGNDNSAINAYVRLNDGTLAVMKEDNTNGNIFYRTSKEIGGKDNTISPILFPIKSGSIGESVINRYASASLAGDNLILSQNGVFGIELTNNISTNERYAKFRSRPINEKLRYANLANAVAITYKNRYYLVIDGECYVADARYKYSSKDNVDNSFNYEWWHWDNIPARVFGVIDSALYFGTNDGKICVFDDKYTDRTYATVVNGGITIDIKNNQVQYSQNLDIKENDKVQFRFDGVDGVCDSDGRVYKNNLYVANLDKKNYTFQLKHTKNGDILDIALNGNSPYKSPQMKIISEQNVVAEWYTPVLDLGSNAISKTLLAMTISTSSDTRGRIDFGYLTRKSNQDFATKGIVNSGGLDFSKLDFTNFSFECNRFMTSYTKQCREKNVNYIQFKFSSDYPHDCVINNFSIEYRLDNKQKGVN